ncbi:MAG TPA: response regulator [Gammaproteobacteria bacterium]|nr:response regulator [Gammaproteobacteria bacterium]
MSNKEHKKKKIFIVDDHPVFRRGIRQLLQLAVEIELIGEAANCDEALTGIAATQPDLVLLDLRLGENSGLELLRKIRSQWPAIKVVILTVSDAEEDLTEALRDGATGYLLKDMEPEELLEGVRHALKGKIILSQQLRSALGRVLNSNSGSHNGQDIKDVLSRRECEIVAAVALGKTNKMIAQLLGITEETVKVHMKRILRRTRLKNRVELAVWVNEQSRLVPATRAVNR